MQEPHFNQWVNHIRAGLYCMVAWAGLLLVILAFSSQRAEVEFRQITTNAMLGGLLPMLLFGAAVSYVRLRWATQRALKAIRCANEIMRVDGAPKMAAAAAFIMHAKHPDRAKCHLVLWC